jgi:CRISPR-associated protein Cas5d
MHNDVCALRVRGRLACFTRPEFSTERVSYHVITPSAARGIVEAVLWKPAIRWQIRRILVLGPVRWMQFRRNEVNSKVPTRDAMAALHGGTLRDYFADEDRAQRNTVALRDVDYIIEAVFSMTPQAGLEDNPGKFRDMFQRRVEKGQHAFQPYLGCREFPADVSLPEKNLSPIDESCDLGWMLQDMDYGYARRPRFFRATMQKGVIDVPTWQQGGDA